MIRVSFAHLAMVYLAIMLTPITFAWIVAECRRSSRERQARRGLVRCVLCGSVFRDDSGAEIVECPACGRANERGAFEA